MVRKKLFSDGFRYRLNNTDLPGKPDIVRYNGAMAIEFYYIVGKDCAIRKSGRVSVLDVFDGPHSDESEAHSVAASMIASGDYRVIASSYRDRERARQTYNHEFALSSTDSGKPVGAARAVQNKYRLREKPVSERQRIKSERDAAWGR